MFAFHYSFYLFFLSYRSFFYILFYHFSLLSLPFALSSVLPDSLRTSSFFISCLSKCFTCHLSDSQTHDLLYLFTSPIIFSPTPSYFPFHGFTAFESICFVSLLLKFSSNLHSYACSLLFFTNSTHRSLTAHLQLFSSHLILTPSPLSFVSPLPFTPCLRVLQSFIPLYFYFLSNLPFLLSFRCNSLSC